MSQIENFAIEMEEEGNNFTKCHFFDKEHGDCGSFSRWKSDKIFGIKELSDDVSSYFNTLKLDVDTIWSEKSLIENRAHSVLPTEGFLCSYHRYSLGIGWKPLNRCYHPEHKFEAGKKGPKTRPVPLASLRMFNQNALASIPVGANFCYKHLKQESLTKVSTCQTETQPLSPVAETQDEAYIPDVPLIDPETIDMAAETASSLCSSLMASPIQFQIKQKRVSDLSEGTKIKLRQKFERIQASLKEKYAEAVAPGQAKDFIEEVLLPKKEVQECSIPDDLKVLIKLYAEGDASAKTMILCTANHEKYSKEELMEYFKCSRYQIDLSRKLIQNMSGLSLPKKKQQIRSKIPPEKIEHFLDFLFTRGLLQDVAYGVNKIKFDSGAEKKVANAILTMKFSHTISYYKEICQENLYVPLSDASLWRILHGIKPSQRKALAGLDDITAEAMNAFSYLHDIAGNLDITQSLAKSLDKGKRYLKGIYQSRCSKDSHIKSHSTIYALSDPENQALDQTASCLLTDDCMDCYELASLLNNIHSKAKDSNNGDLMYDVDNAVTNINIYWKHQIRDAQQKQAKVMAFENLSERCGFWLKDYCQKVLPMKYREGQKEYFGKKGMSLHVDVIFAKDMEKIIKKVYFTAMYRCDQGIIDSLCLADVVTDQIKKDFPKIETLYAKSDNAGSYHGNYYAEALYSLCQRKSIYLKRYDYNEPCKGKDQCDRESAGAKSLMRSYVDAGNNILSAEDIYKSLHYGSGVKNASVAVININSQHSVLKGSNTIPKISQYHSIEFFQTHMLLWRYYDIGVGVKQEYSGVEFIPSVEIIYPYSLTSKNKSSTDTSNPKRCRLQLDEVVLFCPEPSCSYSSLNNKELEEHLLSEKHSKSDVSSMVDTARELYIKQMECTSSSLLPMQSLSEGCSSSCTNIVTENCFLFKEKGWALPIRRLFRYSEKQKQNLYKIFMQGEETGKKKTPEQVHKELRKTLSPSECVTSQQIRSLFSRWSKQCREGKTIRNEDNQQDERQDIDEQVDSRHELEEDVYDNETLGQVAHELSVIDVAVDDWVVVAYQTKWYPGIVKSLHETDVVVSCMEGNSVKNMFRWPKKPDVISYENYDIIAIIDPVVPVNHRGDFKMMVSDVELANKNFSIWCQADELR